MDTDELVREMKAKTFPRIRDLMISRYKEATADPHTDVGEWLSVFFGPLEEGEEPSSEMLEYMWGGSLTEMAVHILWAVENVSVKRIFTANHENLAAAVKVIYTKALARDTGLQEEDVPFTLLHMVDSLALIIHEHATIDIQIDNKSLRLQAKKPSIFRRIFKFIFLTSPKQKEPRQ